MIIEIKNQKFFHEQSFNFELNNELLKTDINDAELKESDEIFLEILDKHIPKKQKYIRANNSNHIKKALPKGIIHRCRYRTKFLREQPNLRLLITKVKCLRLFPQFGHQYCETQ